MLNFLLQKSSASRKATVQIGHKTFGGKEQSFVKSLSQNQQGVFQVSIPRTNCFCVASSALFFLTRVLHSHLHSCSCRGPWEFCVFRLAQLFCILLQARGRFSLCLAPQIQLGTKTTHEKIPCFPVPAQPRGFPATLRVETSWKPDGNVCVKPADYQRPDRAHLTESWLPLLRKYKGLFEGTPLKVLKGQLPKNNQKEDYTNLRITEE